MVVNEISLARCNERPYLWAVIVYGNQVILISVLLSEKPVYCLDNINFETDITLPLFD